MSRSRPFYAGQADVFDLLVTDSTRPWVTAVDERLRRDGSAPATILDAGCGTGRHAWALLALGHGVTLADASPELLALAQQRCPTAPAWLFDISSFTIGEFGAEPFDAVTCRGVLNDLLSDQERQAALTAMASALRVGGVLFLDVREFYAARERADGRPHVTDVALPGGESLRYTYVQEWAEDRLQVHEVHERTSAAGSVSTEYDFAMRPWTIDEIRAGLRQAGLSGVTVAPGVDTRRGDRLFVTAVRRR